MDHKITELERLAKLRAAGALSTNEFDREKARVLGIGIPGDISWIPVAPWFPRRYIKGALTAVAVCSVVGLAAGTIAYRATGNPGKPPLPSPTEAAGGGADQMPMPAPYPTTVAVPTEAVSAPVDEPCDQNTRRTFARKADVPAGAMAVFGGDMAEVGSDFQMTDAGPVSDLPGRRFVSARQTGCTISLRYEQGGIAHTFETVELTFGQGQWTKTGDR
jgi:hypothetical protein